MSDSNVHVARRGPLGILTLARPATLNAVDLAMLRALYRTLMEWRDEPLVERVVLRGEGERAFCAGGDVKAVWAKRGDAAFMDEVYRVEYELDYLIHTYPKPFIALVHGITMGGGCGLAFHAAHRVAAEDLVFAMPETAIGLFPDVGASRFLAACPDGIGLYLGLTGARLSAAQALRLGLVDHVVSRADHSTLCARLAKGEDVTTTLADAAIEIAVETPTLQSQDEIREVFAPAESVHRLMQALVRRGTPFATRTSELLRSMSPFSLELTFQAIRRGARPLSEVLRDDFRLAQRLMTQGDYFEGVRAMLIDKDRHPVWNPARLEDVDLTQVEAMFSPLSSRELWA